MKKAKLSIKEQIEVLTYAKNTISVEFELFSCLAIKNAIRNLKYSDNYRDIYTVSYIPLHTRKHAIELCKQNNIPLPNTNCKNSSEVGWWLFEEQNMYNNLEWDHRKMRSVRIKYLDALINELKKML